MRRILAALAVAGAIGFAASAPASADVVIQTPGFTVEQHPPVPYWRQRQEERWAERQEFRDEQYRHQEWVQNHCVRDWSGREYCRP